MLRLCFCYLHSGWELNQWGYLVASFPVDEVFVIGNKDADMQGILKQSTLIESAEELPDAELIVAAPRKGRFVQGSVDLKTFNHPEDAIYLFGLDHVNLSEDELGGRTPDHMVYIDAEDKWELYAHVAAAIFLYDRKVKAIG